ncbi:cuticle protein 7-like [Eriocheir sinensis]|uniref:cuticle protein 7-like n=1 Tax=Eriocheir sinensis TaxID=95602 RepID=UPI0021CA885B|nr:cuticle protein 7-like [Eriocheir sinensis]
MFTKVATLLVAAAALGVVSAHPSDSYGHPQTYKEDPIPYTFQYGVRDDYSGANFGQNEESDGSQTSGSYQVVLPDGRIQTVNYVADHYNGFQADVSYKGEAQYPHQYGPAITFKPAYGAPSYNPPAPSYSPPSYSPPAPSYH